MATDTTKLTREDVAKIEIGQTDVRPSVAWTIIVVFFLTVFAVPVSQHVYEIRQAFAANPSLRWTAVSSYLPRCYDIFRSLPRAWQAVRGAPGPRGGAASLLNRVRYANNRVLLRDINEYSDALKEDSLLSDLMLAPVQRLMAGCLGVGNEQAYVGRDGWLFYRPGVDYVTGPGFLSARHVTRREKAEVEWQDPPVIDPIPAIVDFARQLDRRGIRLMLLPTPVKPVIHPEKLSRRFEGFRQALRNPSFESLQRRLDEQLTGARRTIVLDPADDLIARKFAGDGAPRELYLRADTHWTPETMDFVAGMLARAVTPLLDEGASDPNRSGWVEQPAEVTNTGDIAGMVQPCAKTPPVRRLYRALGLGRFADAGLPDVFPRQTVTVRRVLDAGGRPWKADGNAQVLLLGDSFSNIYSSGEMGWGDSAGLAERLSFHLRHGVDSIIRNDAGSHATRKMLADELRAGRDRLAGKKVVVWQFAVRELAVGDWQKIELKQVAAPPKPPPAVVATGKVLALKPGQVVQITGKIAALERPGRPGQVPYKDFIMPLHLVDVRDEKGTVRGAEAVVFLWGMRNNEWTAAARWSDGQTVTVRVRPWEDVLARFGSVRRGELADVDIDVPTVWCEELK